MYNIIIIINCNISSAGKIKKSITENRTNFENDNNNIMIYEVPTIPRIVTANKNARIKKHIKKNKTINKLLFNVLFSETAGGSCGMAPSTLIIIIFT